MALSAQPTTATTAGGGELRRQSVAREREPAHQAPQAAPPGVEREPRSFQLGRVVRGVREELPPLFWRINDNIQHMVLSWSFPI